MEAIYCNHPVSKDGERQKFSMEGVFKSLSRIWDLGHTFSHVLIDKWLIHLAEGSWLFSLTQVILNSFLQC